MAFADRNHLDGQSGQAVLGFEASGSAGGADETGPGDQGEPWGGREQPWTNPQRTGIPSDAAYSRHKARRSVSGSRAGQRPSYVAIVAHRRLPEGRIRGL